MPLNKLNFINKTNSIFWCCCKDHYLKNRLKTLLSYPCSMVNQSTRFLFENFVKHKPSSTCSFPQNFVYKILWKVCKMTVYRSKTHDGLRLQFLCLCLCKYTSITFCQMVKWKGTYYKLKYTSALLSTFYYPGRGHTGQSGWWTHILYPLPVRTLS